MDALLVIDKPLGLTSFDVVAKVRRLLKERRIGHAGTLDPLATGVLLLCLGEMTKLVPYLMDADKEYLATARLGVATDTDDADPKAQVLSQASRDDLLRLKEANVRAVLARFQGEVLQRPPRFSALKLDGKRLYAQARKAREKGAAAAIEVPSDAVLSTEDPSVNDPAAEIEAAIAGKTRIVRIDAITVEDVRLLSEHDPPGTWPEVQFRVRCGKGTYIRSLARDLGDALGVGAHLSALRRLRVGPFDVSGAVPPDQAQLATRHDLVSAVAHLPQLRLSQSDATRVRCGQPTVLGELAPQLAALLPSSAVRDGTAVVAVLDPQGSLVAIVQPVAAAGDADRAVVRGAPPRFQIARGFVAPTTVPAASKEAPCITGCA